MLEMGSHVVCPALRTPAGGSRRLDCCSRLSPPMSGIMRAPSRLWAPLGKKAQPGHPGTHRPSHRHPHSWGGGWRCTKSQPLYLHSQLWPQFRPSAPPTLTISLPGPNLLQYTSPSADRPVLLSSHPDRLRTTSGSSPNPSLPSIPTAVVSAPTFHPHSSPKRLAFPQLASKP